MRLEDEGKGGGVRPIEVSPFSSPIPGGKKRIDLALWLKGDREAVILHRGEEYLLRITKKGKLILTK